MLKPIRFLDRKMELTLGDVIQILSLEHHEQTVKELIRKYVLQSTSDDIIKIGLEFLYMNGFQEDLQLLIRKNQKSTNASNRNWAVIYQMMINHQQKQYSPRELLQQLNCFHTDEPELKCLAAFLRTSIFFNLHDYDQVGNLLENQTDSLELIEDGFLRTNFKIRLSENLFTYYWIRNELIIARKYAYRALNNTTSPLVKIRIHNNLGLSYIFDTYSQGMYHLSTALELAKQHHLTDYVYKLEQCSIPFLCAHFNKVDGGIQSEVTKEQAYIEIAKGNYTKAEELLRDVSMENPFALYYMGVAKCDKQLLMQSREFFIEKQSNYFFSRLPLQALKAM